jgi:negative regulator of sigma-B (phosphoserine phosphatase)
MPERLLEVGIASSPAAGEERSGDLAVVELLADGALVGAVDALGHGARAAPAAEIAGTVLRRHPTESPHVLVERCHDALRGTRGVALSLASFSSSRGTVTWVGVGNVEGRLMRPAPAGATTIASLTTAPGTVGSAPLPRLAAATVQVERGDTVLFATDGVGRDFADSLELAGTAQALAARLLEEHGRADDDALVLVARVLESAP